MKKVLAIGFGLALGWLALPAVAGEEAAKCKTSEHCERGQYCKKADGECKSKGMCAPRPEICTTEYDPVCGCDDQTYSNACRAAMAGVNVKHEGACGDEEPDAKACMSNEDCRRTDFCAKRTGDCKGKGRCQPRPEFCPQIFDPVCGCDGKTYSNACTAFAAGVNVEHDGECKMKK